MDAKNKTVSALSILRRFPILDSLTDTELQQLIPILSAVKFRRGDYLFREGSPGDSLYFLYEGTVVAEKVIDKESGAKKNLALIPSGTFFGEMAIIDDSPRSAAVRAEINIEAFEVKKEDFAKFQQRAPEIAYKLLRSLFREMSARLRNTNEELVAIYDIGKILASIQDFRELVSGILQRIVCRLGSSYGLFAIYFEEVKEIEVIEALGKDSEKLKGLKIPAETGLVGNSIAKKTPFLVEKLIGLTEPWESESMILSPLLTKERLIGMYILGVNADGSPYTTSDLHLTSAIANLTAPAIDFALQKWSGGS
jgi:CRP-like cAMP-binding protein